MPSWQLLHMAPAMMLLSPLVIVLLAWRLFDKSRADQEPRTHKESTNAAPRRR